MKSRYGDYDDTQVDEYLKRIHGMVHWLLIYKERRNPILNSYFNSVQDRIYGLNSLFNNTPEIINLSIIIEQARLEHEKGKLCDRKKYRRLIFDAHSAIDQIVHKEGVAKNV